MNPSSGVRRTLTALLAVLACTGCSVTVFSQDRAKSPPTAPAPQTLHSGLASGLPRLLTPHLNPQRQAAPPAGATPRERTFMGQVNGFCRRWYVDQRNAALRYPAPSQEGAFERLEAAHEAVLTRQLSAILPPSTASATFSEFVANEQLMVGARGDLASPDQATVDKGNAEYLDSNNTRHTLAHQLGTRLCDGVLPPRQAVAAERAAQRFDLTTDIRQGCVTLVMPQFLDAEWGGSPSPLASCRQHFRVQRLGSQPTPRNIKITTVTGVENLSATVVFSEVPPCGCPPFSARLYDEQGRWLVFSMSDAS